MNKTMDDENNMLENISSFKEKNRTFTDAQRKEFLTCAQKGQFLKLISFLACNPDILNVVSTTHGHSAIDYAVFGFIKRGIPSCFLNTALLILCGLEVDSITPAIRKLLEINKNDSTELAKKKDFFIEFLDWCKTELRDRTRKSLFPELYTVKYNYEINQFSSFINYSPELLKYINDQSDDPIQTEFILIRESTIFSQFHKFLSKFLLPKEKYIFNEPYFKPVSEAFLGHKRSKNIRISEFNSVSVNQHRAVDFIKYPKSLGWKIVNEELTDETILSDLKNNHNCYWHLLKDHPNYTSLKDYLTNKDGYHIALSGLGYFKTDNPREGGLALYLKSSGIPVHLTRVVEVDHSITVEGKISVGPVVIHPLNQFYMGAQVEFYSKVGDSLISSL